MKVGQFGFTGVQGIKVLSVQVQHQFVEEFVSGREGFISLSKEGSKLLGRFTWIEAPVFWVV